MLSKSELNNLILMTSYSFCSHTGIGVDIFLSLKGTL